MAIELTNILQTGKISLNGKGQMRKRYRRVSISQYLVVSLAVLIVLGLGFLSTVVMRHLPFEDNFVIPWAAGRTWLLQGADPYSEQVTQLAQQTLADSSYLARLPDKAVFTDPVLNLVFTIPFSLLPYEISRAIWVVVILICVGLIGYFGLKLSGWKLSFPEAAGIILLVTLWFTGIQTAVMGKSSPIVILLVLVGIYAILKEQDTLAGFLFALTFGTWQISTLFLLLIIIWSITRRRWQVLIAYFAGLAFLWVITLILLPSWPLGWLGVMIKNYAGFSWIHTPLIYLAKQLPGIGTYLSIGLHAGFGIYLLVLFITILGKSGREFTWKILAFLVLIYLFDVEASIHQIFLVLPAIFLVFRFWSERWGFWGQIFSLSLMVGITAVSWILAAPAFALDGSIGFGALIVGLPIFAFFGMISIRWWALKIPRLPFERQ